MSKKFVPAQLFNIKPSINLIYGLFLVHTLAIGCVFLLGLGVFYSFFLLILVLVSLFVHLNSRNDFIAIRFNANSGWHLAYQDNGFFPVTVLRSTVISTFLIVFHCEMENNQKRTILIVKDSLSGDEFRQLIVILKIVGVQSSS